MQLANILPFSPCCTSPGEIYPPSIPISSRWRAWFYSGDSMLSSQRQKLLQLKPALHGHPTSLCRVGVGDTVRPCSGQWDISSLGALGGGFPSWQKCPPWGHEERLVSSTHSFLIRELLGRGEGHGAMVALRGRLRNRRDADSARWCCWAPV